MLGTTNTLTPLELAVNLVSSLHRGSKPRGFKPNENIWHGLRERERERERQTVIDGGRAAIIDCRAPDRDLTVVYSAPTWTGQAVFGLFITSDYKPRAQSASIRLDFRRRRSGKSM